MSNDADTLAPPAGTPTTGPRRIEVDILARVEGEGAMRLVLDGDRVEEVELRIFEPPRFFEGLLRGRRFTEAPDITARICGICPVAYQMSSCHAMEQACGVRVDGPLRALRRLLYCGEWIESHALHIFMLHAPDFLGYESGLHMAADHPELVERGLRLKRTGNDLMALLGGRAVHPINVRVGGFYRVPDRHELEALVEPLERGRNESLETVRWLSGLDFPDFERPYELVALRHPDEYPMNEGRLVSTAGLDIPASAFEDHFEETHVERSNALHCRLVERGAYFVGPLARYALNRDRLSAVAREAADEVGLEPVCRNPFRGILVRGVEMLHAFDEALRIIGEYEEPERPSVTVEPCAGVGHAITEAPRGILYHRYRIDDDGLIREARIVPPTSQNQETIEEDLRAFAGAHLDLPDEHLTRLCEQAIRNYDPCISCATHFLDLEIERR